MSRTQGSRHGTLVSNLRIGTRKGVPTYGTQAAVDRYLKDYHRIKTLQQFGHNLDFIHLATQIAKHVIVQYTNLINMEEN